MGTSYHHVIAESVGESIESKIKEQYYKDELDKIESNIKLFEEKKEEINEKLSLKRGRRQIALAALELVTC